MSENLKIAEAYVRRKAPQRSGAVAQQHNRAATFLLGIHNANRRAEEEILEHAEQPVNKEK